MGLALADLVNIIKAILSALNLLHSEGTLDKFAVLSDPRHESVPALATKANVDAKHTEFVLQELVNGDAAGAFDKHQVLADPRHPAIEAIAGAVKDKLDSGWKNATTPPNPR